MQQMNKTNSDCFEKYIPGRENYIYLMFANVQYALP